MIRANVDTIGNDQEEEADDKGLVGIEEHVEEGAGAEPGSVRLTEGNDDRMSMEAQTKENAITWELAVESGAVLLDEDVDIMGILQAQNEEIARKRKLAKQKAKARMSRPKNKQKVSSNLFK
ncbi:hypothetical protein AHAS_Ahas05G0111900 [Arachis hypogaea]